MLLVLILVCCIVNHIIGSLCYWCNWFITLLVLLLVHHVVGSSCYDVDVLLVNHIVPMYIPEPLVLFFCVVGCYSHW